LDAERGRRGKSLRNPEREPAERVGRDGGGRVAHPLDSNCGARDGPARGIQDRSADPRGALRGGSENRDQKEKEERNGSRMRRPARRRTPLDTHADSVVELFRQPSRPTVTLETMRTKGSLPLLLASFALLPLLPSSAGAGGIGGSPPAYFSVARDRRS